MNELELYDKTRQTDVTATLFSDGMVVTADDLATAMSYPIELMQTLIRAYFGCGVVCGFEVEKTSTFCVRVNVGTALNCHGHPLRLCASEDIDLTPDPCASEWPEKVCIAISRATACEAPRADGDGCGQGAEGDCQHRRRRELIRIKVFCAEDLPKNLCRRKGTEDHWGDGVEPGDPCDCLKACSDCHCCGEAWVLLACVHYLRDDKECLVGIEIDDSRRKYVKPIECLCPPGYQGDSSDDDSQTAAAAPAASRTSRTSRTSVRARPAAKQAAAKQAAAKQAAAKQVPAKKAPAKKAPAKKAPAKKVPAKRRARSPRNAG